MSFENFKKIILQAKPIYIQLSGTGETFLHPEIEKILFFTASTRAAVKITSNGYLLHKSISNAIIDSGVTMLDISLDTTDEDLYGKIRIGGNLEKVLDNVRYLAERKKERNSMLVIRAVLLYSKTNIFRLVDDIEDICKLPFDEVSLGGASQLFQQGKINKIDNWNEVFLIIDQATKKARELGRPDLMRAVLLFKYHLLAHHYERNIEDGCNRICYLPSYSPYIMVDGTMLPCCICPMWVLEKKENCELFNMGNVFDEGFDKVWRGKKSREIRRNVLENRGNFGFCKYCGYTEMSIFKIINNVSKFVYNTN